MSTCYVCQLAVKSCAYLHPCNRWWFFTRNSIGSRKICAKGFRNITIYTFGIKLKIMCSVKEWSAFLVYRKCFTQCSLENSSRKASPSISSILHLKQNVFYRLIWRGMLICCKLSFSSPSWGAHSKVNASCRETWFVSSHEIFLKPSIKRLPSKLVDASLIFDDEVPDASGSRTILGGKNVS